MTTDVCSPDYWRAKMHEACARGEIHRMMFNGSVDEFKPVDALQRSYLRSGLEAAGLGPSSSVFDAGCGYGRLLSFLPGTWKGEYLGMDVSPDLLGVARTVWPGRTFVLGDLRQRQYNLPRYDVGVALWLREMIVRDMGPDVWAVMLGNIVPLCRKLVVVDLNSFEVL